MKNRILVVIFAALGLMACSKSKTSYVGNTYEGKLGEITTLTYQFLSESEFRLDLNSSWSGHHNYVCHYVNVVDYFKEKEPENYKPLAKFLDGCAILGVDSIYDPSSRCMILPCEFFAYPGNNDLNEIMSTIFYNNEADEIIILDESSAEDLIERAVDIVEKGSNPAPNSIRSELQYLGGITCPRKTK